jgi:hypothetical protein
MHQFGYRATKQFLALHLAALAVSLLAATPGRAYSDEELINSFNRTVFGSEFASWGWQSRIVKKFTGPVRFYIDDRSDASRRREAMRFVRALPGAIAGLQAEVVTQPDRANFRVFIVNRRAYDVVVRQEIYRQPTASFVPGKCLVRVVSGRNGISRADAVIVADEGDFLFRRCLIEEVLQGLGPVNDDASLKDSVFNDESRHSTFTLHDRYILNLLYDPNVRPGMSRSMVRSVLPAAIRDVRPRLEPGR